MTADNVTSWETCSLTNLEPTPFSLLDVDMFAVFLTKTNCYVAFGNCTWALAVAVDLCIVWALCMIVIMSWLELGGHGLRRMCRKRYEQIVSFVITDWVEVRANNDRIRPPIVGYVLLVFTSLWA